MSDDRIHHPRGEPDARVGLDGQTIRKHLLEVVARYTGQSSLQSGVVLREGTSRLGRGLSTDHQQAVLTVWNDLFRTGLLGWGYDLSNAEPPFCHVTERGRETLRHLSRDPANPDGYLAYLGTNAKLDGVSRSYIEEALICYNSACFKATAVMVGASAEGLILRLRDTLVAVLEEKGSAVPAKLKDWRVKTVRDAITSYLDRQKGSMPKDLGESYDAYWTALAEQVRRVRNEAGHPSVLDPVTPESVHAGLLILPELAKLVSDLETWIAGP